MARRRGHSDEHDNAERWLLTYADMITLLMAFFIMLYSMSQLDIKKFDAMTGSVQAQLGGTGILKASMNATQVPEQRTGAPGIAPSLGGGPGELKRTLEKQLSALVAGLQVSSQGDEVTVVLPATTIYFAAGSAEPTLPMQRALQALAQTLAQGRYVVKVTGHTCNLPVHNARVRSNWELSADRARNVAFRLIRYGAVKAENCSFMGLAATQPAFPNDTEAHRARNRRVEIKIKPLPSVGGTLSPRPANTRRSCADASVRRATGNGSPGTASHDAVSPAANGQQPVVDIGPHLERAMTR